MEVKMVKEGGVSYNTGSDKKGVRTSHRCSICKREYKMEWAKDRHERLCKEFELSKSR